MIEIILKQIFPNSFCQQVIGEDTKAFRVVLRDEENEILLDAFGLTEIEAWLSAYEKTVQICAGYQRWAANEYPKLVDQLETPITAEV